MTGLLEPYEEQPSRTAVCPAKADTFSGSHRRQGKSQSLVARMAGKRETESLKPIDKTIFCKVFGFCVHADLNAARSLAAGGTCSSGVPGVTPGLRQGKGWPVAPSW